MNELADYFDILIKSDVASFWIFDLDSCLLKDFFFFFVKIDLFVA